MFWRIGAGKRKGTAHRRPSLRASCPLKSTTETAGPKRPRDDRLLRCDGRRLLDGFPRQAQASEVAVIGRLTEDRTEQIELLDDGARPEVERVHDELLG